jgi:hypothetical protein
MSVHSGFLKALPSKPGSPLRSVFTTLALLSWLSAPALAQGMDSALLEQRALGDIFAGNAALNAVYSRPIAPSALASWNGVGVVSPQVGARRGELSRASALPLDAIVVPISTTSLVERSPAAADAAAIGSHGQAAAGSSLRFGLGGFGVALVLALTLLAVFNSRKRWPSLRNVRAY